MIENILAPSLASASTVLSTGMLFETGLKPINAWYTARSALWQKRVIISSSRSASATTSRLLDWTL